MEPLTADGRMQLEVFSTKGGAAASVMIVDRSAGDIVLVRAEGNSVDAVRQAVARELREMARRCDDLPVVTRLTIRNDPHTAHVAARDEAYALVGATSLDPIAPNPALDVMKVTVQLEHEPGVERMIHDVLVDREAFSQQVDYASNAYYFARKEEDPVVVQWLRKEKARRPDLDDAEYKFARERGLLDRTASEIRAIRVREIPG